MANMFSYVCVLHRKMESIILLISEITIYKERVCNDRAVQILQHNFFLSSISTNLILKPEN